MIEEDENDRQLHIKEKIAPSWGSNEYGRGLKKKLLLLGFFLF